MKILTLIIFIFMTDQVHAECISPAPCIETDSTHEHRFVRKIKESIERSETFDLINFAKF